MKYNSIIPGFSRNIKKRKSIDLSKYLRYSGEIINSNCMNKNSKINNGFFIRKKAKAIITRLLNSSKNMVKNTSKYKSFPLFPKNISYSYPYKPNDYNQVNISLFSSFEQNRSRPFSSKIEYRSRGMINKTNKMCLSANRENMKKNEPILSLRKEIDNDFTYNSDNNRKILLRKNDEFSGSENKMNEFFFKNFIEKINSSASIIHNYNEYKNKYFIDKNQDGNKKNLNDFLDNYEFQETQTNYFANEFNSKKIQLNIENSLITMKISSLCLHFNEIEGKKQTDNNSNKTIIKDKYINEVKKNTSKLKFPFEFMALFYGISFNDFNYLLLSIIDYNYENNKFTINQNKFFEKYYAYKANLNFYDYNSFFHNYNDKKSKEYFKFNWDVKANNNIIKNFIIKIILPKMKINIRKNGEKKIKFYSTIDIKTMGYFLKENFKDWDYYVLNHLSQYKVFRYEINKILYNKCPEVQKIRQFLSKIKTFNLNSANTILNTTKINEKSYDFFYSHKKDDVCENNLFHLVIPKISICYRYLTNVVPKNFDLNIKRMQQLVRLRKSFSPEDLVRYSIIYIKDKKYYRDREKKDTSNHRFRSGNSSLSRVKRDLSGHDTVKKESHLNINSKENEKRESNKFFSALKQVENVKDIQLELDKYIFNFDKDITKFIDVNDTHKMNYYNKGLDNISTNFNFNFNFNDYDKFEEWNNKCLVSNKNLNIYSKKKLTIDIGKTELEWTNQASNRKIYLFEKSETEYLFDHSPNIWRKYIENNINKFESKQNQIKKSKNKKKSTIRSRGRKSQSE